MAKDELTIQRQILYILEWFPEFSDFQRFDFLNIHLLPISDKFISSHLLQVQKNGISSDVRKCINDVSINYTGVNGSVQSNEFIRPPSIFECRMKLLKDWTKSWTDNDLMDFFKRLNNLNDRFVRQTFRLYLHQNKIDSYDSFQSKIIAENEFLNDFQLDQKLFEMPLESSIDECFYSIVDCEQNTNNKNELTFTSNEKDNYQSQDKKINENVEDFENYTDNDREDSHQIQQNEQTEVKVEIKNESVIEQ